METIINYAGLAIGLVLAIIGIILQIKSNKNKEPVYSIKSVNVISDYASKYENLTVSYKGEKVENFTVSKVLFYNRGAETITRQDIETLNHLRIIGIERTEIIETSILQNNNPSNDFKIDLDRVADSAVYIYFDYIDKNQGTVIQVIHTGLSSEDMKVVGDVKGVEKPTRIKPEQLTMKSIQQSKIKALFSGMLVPVIIFSLFFLVFPNTLFVPGTTLANRLSYTGTMIALALVAMGILRLMLFIFTERYFIPEGLEKFLE